MFVCPVCNGMRMIKKECPACLGPMNDQGKVVDYYGDYSPYLPNEIVKSVDDEPRSSQNYTCVHLFQCEKCAEQQRIEIQEVPK